MTPAQTALWRGLRRSNPDLPKTFAPGTYRCPAHDDGSASLSVSYEGYRVLLNCHGPCNADQVRRRLGVSWSDLRDDGPAHGKREVATYTYVDERGVPLFRVVRFEPKDFRHQHPTDDGWAWGHGGAPYVLYRLPKVLEAVRTDERVWIVEGEKDGEALEALGVAATTNAGGAGKIWRPEYVGALRGAYVTIVADRDEAGRKHAREVYAALRDVAAEVKLVEPAVNKPHADVSDHLAAGFALDDLAPLDPGSGGSEISGTRSGPPPRCDLAKVEKLFRAHHEHGDLVALRATLASYQANVHLGGDPVWLGLVSGSSTGKTETAGVLVDCPHVLVASTLTGEAALLSGVAQKDRAPGATGGLLRQLGDRGVLVLKDFTTVLSMHPDKRASILSALREVYDGRWSRDIGAEGGTRLEWKGKLGLVMCSTTAYDRAYGVIAVMGDRFVLLRLDDDHRVEGTRAALAGAERADEARAALAEATAGLLGNEPPAPPLEASGADLDQLAALADFVTLARSPVARDFKGEVDLVLDPEGPYRFGKQLYALWRACGLLGLDADAAWQVAGRVARDSMPRLRWRVLDALAARGELTTSAVCRAVWHPNRSTRRALEDLTAHRVVRRTPARGSSGREDRWALTEAAEPTAKLMRDLVPGISDPLPDDGPEQGRFLDQEADR
jgi:5S rRNA maturation endonuclease (ribonuclease M5)